MKIQWIGHACFCITSQTGLKLITDPYKSPLDPKFLYEPVNESADIVTVSHDHADHGYVSAVSGNPVVVRNSGITNVKGIEIKGIPTYHDRVKGAQRGPNNIFVFQIDGIRIAHLGDLGHSLSAEQMGELKGTDILFAPTGGGPTLELQEAIDLWEKLKPRIVIPMHFATPKCTFPKYNAEDLIRLGQHAKMVGASELSVTIQSLPISTQILILDPLR